MLTSVSAFQSTVGPTALRDWDVLMGKNLLDQVKATLGDWSQWVSVSIVMQCDDLVEWAAAEFADRCRSSRRLTPSEYLNLEGSRVVRFLAQAGWEGSCFVLLGAKHLVDEVAASFNEPILLLRVCRLADTDTDTDTGGATWNVTGKLIGSSNG